MSAPDRLRCMLGAGVAAATLASCIGTPGAWARRTWMPDPVPKPPGFRAGLLSGVSCASSFGCVAVGWFDGPHGKSAPLIERWNGLFWSNAPAAKRKSWHGSEFVGVTCTSAWNCIAVGDFTTRDETMLPLAERWNGVRWSIQRVAIPPGARTDGAGLDGVSCSSKDACTAVGEDPFFTRPLVERWNGARWTIQRTPRLPQDEAFETALTGVSCASRTACTAVGKSTDQDGNTVQIVERWNGNRWRREMVPSPPRYFQSALDAVWCTGPVSCMAVGGRVTFGPSTPVVDRRRRARWSVVRTPSLRYLLDPWGSGGGELDGVTCRSARSCVAVGVATSDPIDRVIAERWNGRRWSLESTPPNPTSGILLDVSCPGTVLCFAVGDDGGPSENADLPLVERRW